MSPAEVAAATAAIKARFNGCFGCGMHNPIGLQLAEFVVEGNSVRCTWQPRSHYQSFPEIVHGGIVTAALDEVMAWTGMLLTGHAIVTGTMELRFRRPAASDGVFALAGTLDDRRGRRLMLAGSIADQAGREIASAKGMFITTEDLGLGVVR